MGRFKHGCARRGAKTREFLSWKLMVARCTRESRPDYRYYGGRGISVCARWLEFANFLADMGTRPTPQHSLDRINNDGNYEPGNCRWATRAEQGNNKRSNRWIEFNGKRQTLTAWARELHMSAGTLHGRLAKWPLDRALSEALS